MDNTDNKINNPEFFSFEFDLNLYLCNIIKINLTEN